uniref:Uncharacterized protein n=1 Tax=Daphnia galeata TaxID=27404 RepID=A0A8J2RAN2_9CRUS|nr:unnamed protein product [Daphnia galeata]
MWNQQQQPPSTRKQEKRQAKKFNLANCGVFRMSKRCGRMIPEPAYNEDDRTKLPTGGGFVMDKEGLVVPRKPPNPCIASMNVVDLHRELAFQPENALEFGSHYFTFLNIKSCVKRKNGFAK